MMRLAGLTGIFAIWMVFLIAGCGGGGGGDTPPVVPPIFLQYSIGGSVSGLTGTLVLQDNAGDDKTITTNGAFTFATSIVTGGTYHVTVKTQPAGQTCLVASGSGTIGSANVTNVAVTCTTNTVPMYTLGGSVSGLTGTLVLQNNAGDDKTITVNGAFTFATSMASGGIYNVTVMTQPAGQTCLVASGNGTIGSANVSNVSVTCFGSVPGMVLVPSGCFQMGDTFGDGNANELPVHQVCLDSFHMDNYEVTQGEYLSAVGTNPSGYTSCGSNCPVERVTWQNAYDYCAAAGKRLPTEAEWEYAARSGGQSEKYAGASDTGAIGNYAWYGTNSGATTHPVGQKLSNGLGLYDMSGNVIEWVADWYDGSYYSVSPTNNPTGPGTGTYRVMRGGSFVDNALDTRASYRYADTPVVMFINFGFRCAKTP